MSGDGGTLKKKSLVQVKYKKIHLKDVQFDQGDTFFQSGQFGDVKKAKWNGKVVAVKCFSSADRKGGFQEELVCLSLLQTHPNIVIMHGVVYSDHPFIVLEFAPLSLERALHECKKEYRYTADHVMSWSHQMALGLEYIHSKEMLHRDIKPSNVLLFHHGKTLKLCDFGTAKKLEHTLTNAVGTIRYMAPEVIRGKYYSDRCDIFSFGIVMWEMLTRRRPTFLAGKANHMAIMYAMANGATPPEIPNLPKAISELIAKCFDEEPQLRPPVTEIRKKLEYLCQYVETAKPLIPRRQPKQTPAGSTQSDVFVAAKNDMQHEVKNDKSLKSVDSVEKDEVRGEAGGVNVLAGADDAKIPEAVEAALTDEDVLLRDRSFTAPQRPIQIANEPLSSAGTPHYSKQISSPPTSSPSAYHPPHTSHTPLVQTASVPASRRGVFPSPGTPGLRGQKGGRIGFGHQESEYGELEFQGVTELLSDHDLFQEQSERYQRIEKAMMRTSKEFPAAEIGSSQYAIPGLEPELQPIIPNENNPESMDLYRQYSSVAEQVVRAKREYDELMEENSKLAKEMKSDQQKVAKQAELFDEYRKLYGVKDALMAEYQSLEQEYGSLRDKNASLQAT